MAYQFDFLPVLQNTDLLLRGALFTLELTAIGTLFGVSLGIVGAVVRAWNIRPFAALFGLYVEVIRNTPFLVQLFFIFFGLPGLGVHISEWQAPKANWKPPRRWPCRVLRRFAMWSYSPRWPKCGRH